LASGAGRLAVLATLRAPLVRHCGANNDDRKSGEMIVEKYAWLIFAALAGLCWGTYVPFVQQGIRDLGRNAYGSFCAWASPTS